MSRAARIAIAAGCALGIAACDDSPSKGLEGGADVYSNDASEVADAHEAGEVIDADDAGDVGDADDGGSDALDGRSTCLLVTTTEFRTDGGFSALDAATYSVAPDLTAVHSDAVLRVLDERVFVINGQGADSIQELDPARGYATVSQRAIGGSANPWSLVPVGDGTAWVPLYNQGKLIRVNLDPSAELLTGAEYLVSAAGESDGRADILDAFLFPHSGQDVLFVLVQGLDPYPGCTAGGRGRLLALDPFDMTPVEAFGGASVLELAACNPTGYVLDGSNLVLGHTGGHRVSGHGSDDGGIEVIDLSTGASSGLIATEADFGGRDLVELAFDGESAWLALADDDFGATVHRATLTPFALGPPLWTSENGGVFDLVLADERVWIADRSLLQPGVVVLDAESGERVAGPIDVGYPPFDLAVLSREGGCF